MRIQIVSNVKHDGVTFVKGDVHEVDETVGKALLDNGTAVETDQILSQANAEAARILTEAKAEAERIKAEAKENVQEADAAKADAKPQQQPKADAAKADASKK